MYGTEDLTGTVTRIASRQNPTVAGAARLADKKYRDAEGLFLIDGVKLAEEAGASGLTVEYILLSEAAEAKYLDMLRRICGRIYVLSGPAFERVTDERAPEGVVSAVRYSDSVRRSFIKSDAAYDGGAVLLDGVQNPENFGAVLRSARSFGIDRVICGRGCADIYGRRVMRASMGAALHMGALYTDSAAEACRMLGAHGHRIIAAMPREGADVLGKFEFRRGDVIVIGNEGHGISAEVMENATGSVRIPMAEGQESLNAAAAAAVIMWEMYKSTGL